MDPDRADQSILEHRLGDRDEQCTAERLEEGDHGCGHGYVFEWKYGLHSNDTTLEATTDTRTSEDLITKPVSERCVDCIRGDETGSDGEKSHAQDQDGCVIADYGDQSPRYDR